MAGLVNLNLWMTSVRVSFTQLTVSLIPTQLWDPRPNGKKVELCAPDTGHLLLDLWSGERCCVVVNLRRQQFNIISRDPLFDC